MGVGGENDHAGVHGNEVIAAVEDEDQFCGEDDDYDDLYNDVNVGEGFYQSSAHLGEGVSGGFGKEDENRREPLQASLPPPPVGDLPENAQIPCMVGNLQAESTVDKSAVFLEADFKGSVDSPVWARSPAPPGLPRPDPGQNWFRPGLNQAHRGADSFGNEGFCRQVTTASSDSGANLSVTLAPSSGGGAAAEPSVGAGNNMNRTVSVVSGGAGGGTTTLFVGELHWWTTDADLEAELCKYGPVKEVKFFDEKASGKSKGYAQVEFYDSAAATSCKEGMNGHSFNGKPCVVAFSSPHGVRNMGEARVARNQQGIAQGSSQPVIAQRGRGGGGAHMGGNFGRGGSSGGGGNWGRGGMGSRLHMGNVRNRVGPVGGRGIMGNGGMVAPPPPVFNPGAIFGQGFDPTGYGVAMGRMGAGYGGFPVGPTAGAFPGMLPSFPPVIAPHVNPAFFGRGVPTGGVGLWPDSTMGGWVAEEQSSYGDDAASDQQYGEGSHGKDRGADRDWLGASERGHMRDKKIGHGIEWFERKQYDERDEDWDKDRDLDIDRSWDKEWGKERERDYERERERDRYCDDRDRHADHYRLRDYAPERDDDWDRVRSSKVRSNSREVENVKRRRQSD